MSFYKIQLDGFEGPLDLLLFFIKRDELDIYDIPISKITGDFMEYLEIIKDLDLEIAGEFILMAATLMQIKVKMLLPKELDDKGEEIDPRMDLVNALLEYKRYKEMAEEFMIFENSQQNKAFRGYYKSDLKEHKDELGIILKNITIYDLMLAFKKALENIPKETFHEVRKINVTIDQQIAYISSRVRQGKRLRFLELVTEMKDKIRIIVTFIAMLEMIRSGMIGLRETETFNDFEIFGVENG